MNRKLLLDMDGVVADFVGGVYREILRAPVPDTVRWDFVPKHAWSQMGTSFWRDLEPTPEFGAICAWIEENFGWDNTAILSSPCNTPGCMDGKLRWIERHMPQLRRRFLFGPPKEFCAGVGHYLLDDRDENVAAFKQAGGIGFLLPRSWNRLSHTPVEDALALYRVIMRAGDSFIALAKEAA